jgi:hypothetical protein
VGDVVDACFAIALDQDFDSFELLADGSSLSETSRSVSPRISGEDWPDQIVGGAAVRNDAKDER